MPTRPARRACQHTVGDCFLTLPWLKHRGFFLQPAHLLVARLGVRVEAVCPEAFSSEEDVSLCPRVHTSANATARILSAAF